MANSRLIKFGSAPDLTTPNSASSLVLSNGFNLNSTSTKAWEKVLFGKSFGTRNFDIRYEKNESDFTETPTWVAVDDSIKNVFFNNPQSAIYNLEESESNPRYTFVTRENTPNYIDAFSIDNTAWLTERQYPTFWQSVRELTDSEVVNLADAITTDIHRFGTANGRPFFSVEEFLSEGVLETAINEVSSINNRQGGTDRIPPYTPAHISSMTLMNALGALSFVRSDTFRITTISRTKDPLTGQTLATAKCEAHVQRTPNPHDNVNFGREFHLLDIHWTSTAQ